MNSVDHGHDSSITATHADASRQPLAVTPFLLVGSVRSGTTLLGLMLDHHPKVAFPGEFELAVDRLAEDGSPPTLASYHRWLATDRHFLWHGLRIDPTLDYHDLLSSFLRQMAAESPQKPHIGVALHRRLHLLPHVWPHARYIHLTRDGRDVAPSIIEHGWAGNHFTAAERWLEAEHQWDQCRRILSADQVHEVRFEDLVENPERILQGICAFLDLAYDPAMLSYPDDTTYSAVDAKQAHKWRRKASPRAVQLVEAAAGDMLLSRNYSVAGSRARCGSARRQLMRAHSRLACLAFRLRRYGLRLWIERRLALALRNERWRERVALREHEITNRYLK